MNVLRLTLPGWGVIDCRPTHGNKYAYPGGRVYTREQLADIARRNGGTFKDLGNKRARIGAFLNAQS